MRRAALAGLACGACTAAAPLDTAPPTGPDPFADRVVSFTAGEGGGFGAEELPEVVLGPPRGAGAEAGSLDVVSLGTGGEIVLALDDLVVVDGPGPDLIVFENAFSGWVETAFVEVSDDGERWAGWPCASADAEGGWPGCAGVSPVLSSPGNGLDPTDPDEAGGDAFDLAEVGLYQARFVRITDTGANPATPDTGGFDLDAVAVVNGEAP